MSDAFVFQNREGKVPAEPEAQQNTAQQELRAPETPETRF
jgi:hypothetical protein